MHAVLCQHSSKALSMGQSIVMEANMHMLGLYDAAVVSKALTVHAAHSQSSHA